MFLDENTYDVLFSFDQLRDRELMDVREIRFYVKIHLVLGSMLVKGNDELGASS